MLPKLPYIIPYDNRPKRVYRRKPGSAKTHRIERESLRFIVYTPRDWKRSEVMAHLRKNILNDTRYADSKRDPMLAETIWAAFCMDFVNHWASKHSFKSFLAKWQVRLRVTDRSEVYGVGSF